MHRLIGWMASALLLVAPVSHAAELVFRDASGNAHALSEYAGTPLILHIWASWCPACRQEMPAIDAWRMRHPDAPFVAVSVDDSLRAAQAFLAAKSPHLRLYLATAEDVAKLGVRGTPATLFITPDGRVARLLHGALDWSGDAWLAELAALAEQETAR